MSNPKHLNSETARNVANSLKEAVREEIECGQSRSKKASLIEMAIDLSGYKQMLASPQRLQEAIQKAGEEAAHPYQFPEGLKMTNDFRQEELSGQAVVHLYPKQGSKKIMLYLCGGAYFQQPSKRHWEFLDRLATETQEEIIVPLIKLLPIGNVKTALQSLLILYQRLYDQRPASDINLAGDSSGAGLALAFCEQLGGRKLPQPGHLILISPWLDLDLKNPLIPKYAEKDVMLACSGLRILGNMWADGLDHSDYRLSPINGPLDSLTKVLLFAGTREIMLPDVMTLAEKMRSAKLAVKCVISREMYHTYPLYPTVEGQEAIDQIKDFCQN